MISFSHRSNVFIRFLRGHPKQVCFHFAHSRPIASQICRSLFICMVLTKNPNNSPPPSPLLLPPSVPTWFTFPPLLHQKEHAIQFAFWSAVYKTLSAGKVTSGSVYVIGRKWWHKIKLVYCQLIALWKLLQLWLVNESCKLLLHQDLFYLTMSSVLVLYLLQICLLHIFRLMKKL